MKKSFSAEATFVKVSELGLVLGWAIVCTEKGENYFDKQGDHIPAESMLQAAADFMKNSRAAKRMHEGDRVGDILFAFPMTADIAKSLGIQTERTGLIVAMLPSPEMLADFKSGKLTGFSIGGERGEDEEVA